MPRTRKLAVPKSEKPININNQLNDWVYFPEQLLNSRFKGFEDRDEQSQNRGAFVVGQNMTFSSSRIPTMRSGYAVVGSELANATPVNRAWVFETREGIQWELKAYDTFLYAYAPGVTTDFVLLLSGLTAGLTFGYGNVGVLTESTNHTYFCNGTDSFYRFNGAHATVSGSSVNTISIAASTWTALGFYAATNKIMINGTEYTYTGGEGTATLTGVTPDPSSVPIGAVAIQSPQILSGGSYPLKGQVVFAHDGRLHAREDIKKSVWAYSKLDNPSDFTTGSSDGDGGAKEIEMGGPLLAYGNINGAIVGFKSRLLKSLEFIQSGTFVDSPKWTTLVPTDDKGTSLGATNQKSTFSSPIGLVFVTPDKRMVLLTGVTANNEPQYISISDLVQPVFSTGVHDTGSGICVDNTIWYSFKQDITSTFNDVVIRGDLTRQSRTADGKILPVVWDTPYIGWNVNDWTAVRNVTTGHIDVHWHSSINSNTYVITTDKTDNTLPFTSTLRTWAETFGKPYLQKKIDYVYLEVSMSQSTKLLATLLYDEDGVTQSKEFTLLGTDPQIFDSSVYNPFGANPYGSQMFGSNPTSSSLKRYRYWLETDNNKYFFNLSLQLSAADPGCDFELIRFGYRLTNAPVDIDFKYKKNIN